MKCLSFCQPVVEEAAMPLQRVYHSLVSLLSFCSGLDSTESRSFKQASLYSI